MRCDFAAWLPITANYSKGGMSTIRGFIPHVQVGTGSLQQFFSNPATQASAHFWIAKTGTLEQYVDTDDKAWAEANGNPYFISCEFEGQVDEPMTSAQIDMGGRLIAWVYGNVGQFPLVVNGNPDGQGITPHYAGGQAWGGHSCPGPLRFQQYGELVLAALRYLEPTPAPKPPEDTMNVVYVVRKGKDGKPTGPVFRSNGIDAEQVTTFDDPNVKYRNGWLTIVEKDPPADASVPITDSAGAVRKVWLTDNPLIFGVR